MNVNDLIQKILNGHINLGLFNAYPKNKAAFGLRKDLHAVFFSFLNFEMTRSITCVASGLGMRSGSPFCFHASFLFMYGSFLDNQRKM